MLKIKDILNVELRDDMSSLPISKQPRYIRDFIIG